MNEERKTTVADISGKTTEEVVEKINSLEDEVNHYRTMYKYATGENGRLTAKLNALKAVIDMY